MGNKHRTHGKRVQFWVKRFFEALLDFAYEDERAIWHSTTELEFAEIDKKILVALGAKAGGNCPLEEWKVREALVYYLPKFLGILEDRRKIKKGRGSELGHFKLNLWHSDKEKNLEQFDKEWQQRVKRLEIEPNSKGTTSYPGLELEAQEQEVIPICKSLKISSPGNGIPKVIRYIV
ncbi:MAG: hypothetical protein F6J93_30490 [Oscillatoria sp. SIO1A7]|nr:hypothetical protein [Oscillatoria sp. SIO1A7]